MDAVEMAEMTDAPGFVDGRECVHPVAEPFDDNLRIVRKRFCRAAGGPAAIARQGQRQIQWYSVG